MKIWVTRYGLTSGTFSVEAEVKGDMVHWTEPSGVPNYAHGNDWHFTESDAILNVRERIAKRRAAIAKELKKLDRLEVSL